MTKHNRNLVLCFDTETSGLFKKNESPYILQMSWCIYDTLGQAIIKMSDTYICVPDTVVITDEITAINGATRAKCNAGVSIVVALKQFYEDFQHCGLIVAHNIEFDKRMVMTEWARHRDEMDCQFDVMFSPTWLITNNIKMKCTQSIGTNLCRLTLPNRSGYKYPKLVELYQFLFHETPENLHNSMVDILVCLRCFLKMHYQYDIDSKIFHRITEYYMKSGQSEKRAELLNARMGVKPFYTNTNEKTIFSELCCF